MIKKFAFLLLVVAFAASGPGQALAQDKTYDPVARSTYSHNDVKAFVFDWFAGFDHQAKPETFTVHMDPARVDMQYPDFPITSVADFLRWYDGVIAAIHWNSHDLSNLVVSGSEKDGFDVGFDVRWRAKTYDGQAYDMVIHQDWLVAVDPARQFIITHHRAYPLPQGGAGTKTKK